MRIGRRIPTRSTRRPAITPTNMGSAEKSDIKTPTTRAEAPWSRAKREIVRRLPLNAQCAKTVAKTSGQSGTLAAGSLEGCDAPLDRRMAREERRESAAAGDAGRLEGLRQHAGLQPA